MKEIQELLDLLSNPKSLDQEKINRIGELLEKRVNNSLEGYCSSLYDEEIFLRIRVVEKEIEKMELENLLYYLVPTLKKGKILKEAENSNLTSEQVRQVNILVGNIEGKVNNIELSILLSYLMRSYNAEEAKITFVSYGDVLEKIAFLKNEDKFIEFWKDI